MDKHESQTMSDTTDWIKLRCPELNQSQVNMLVRYIKGLKSDEVNDLVAHIQDKFEEVEVLLNEYQYKRSREIDEE